MLGSAVLAPSVGAVSNAFDALPLPKYNSVHGFHEGTNWDDRTTPFSSAAADIALSAPVLGPVAKTIQGGVNMAKVPLKAMQGPVRQVRNFKPGAGRWPPLTPEPLKEAARSAKGLAQDFATGATTTVRELPGATKDLAVKTAKLANPFSSVNKTMGVFGGGAVGSKGLDYLDENTDFDLDEWTPEFEDERPIDRALELEELEDVYDLDDNNTLSPLSHDQQSVLESFEDPVGDEGDPGREGHLGTSGSMSPTISPELEKRIKESYEFNNVPSLDNIDLRKGTAPPSGHPMHGDSPAFSGGKRVVPSPTRPPQNKIVGPESVEKLQEDLRKAGVTRNPGGVTRTPTGLETEDVNLGGQAGNMGQWAKAPPPQAQPLNAQEQFELDLNKANPRVQQLFSDGEDLKQLRDSGHPASNWEMSRPKFFQKSSSFNPGPSIRRVAAEQRRNRDLGIKAKRNASRLEALGQGNPYGPGIEEALGLKGPRGPRGTQIFGGESDVEDMMPGGTYFDGEGGRRMFQPDDPAKHPVHHPRPGATKGPRGARGEAGPVGMEDAVDEAGAAERQAYFNTHNLEEPTDPEEKTRFSQWYNTHGKRNDQNDRWSDSEPYPKFDPFLA